VEEPSCIRRPDTGQQSRGFRVLYREPQYKRKRVEENCRRVGSCVITLTNFPRASISKTSSHLPSSSLGFPNTPLPLRYIHDSNPFPPVLGPDTRGVHIVMSASFFSATNRISSDPIDHTRGRASIVDGCIVYSPNCGRTVKMPPLFPDIELLLNTGQPIDCLHQPVSGLLIHDGGL